MLEIGGHGALRGILEKRAKVRIRSSQIKRLWTNVQNDQTTAQAE